MGPSKLGELGGDARTPNPILRPVPRRHDKRRAARKCFCRERWGSAGSQGFSVPREPMPSIPLGCISVMQNLYFGTASEARWLEGGSRFPADLVPHTLAGQQQVPKMEPTWAACFGGGRHRVGPSPSVETEKQRHLGGDFG